MLVCSILRKSGNPKLCSDNCYIWGQNEITKSWRPCCFFRVFRKRQKSKHVSDRFCFLEAEFCHKKLVTMQLFMLLFFYKRNIIQNIWRSTLNKKSLNRYFELKQVSRGSQHCDIKTTPRFRLLATSSWSQIAATSYPMPIQIGFIPNIIFDNNCRLEKVSKKDG